MTEATLTASRGLRRGLAVEAALPLRHVTTRVRFEDLERRPISLADGSIHHRNETLVRPGDPWLTVHAAGALGGWDVGGRVGVTVPLGRTEENPFDRARLGLVHQHLQFGTGTWDPLVGVSAGGRAGAWHLGASGLARLVLGENGQGYRAGHRFAAGAVAERPVSGPWRAILGLDVTREEPETWNGVREQEGNLGRTDLLVSLGVGRSVRGAGAFTLSAKVPVITRASGAQLDYPVILVLGWTR